MQAPSDPVQSARRAQPRPGSLLVEQGPKDTTPWSPRNPCYNAIELNKTALNAATTVAMAQLSESYQNHDLPPPPPTHQHQGQQSQSHSSQYQQQRRPSQQQQYYQQPSAHHQQQPSQASSSAQHQQVQPPPSSHSKSKSRSFSFHSDKGHRRSVSKPEDHHESAADKEARRLHSKADPTLAMSEVEPSMEAAMMHSQLAPLRAIQHNDTYGNPIGKPSQTIFPGTSTDCFRSRSRQIEPYSQPMGTTP